MVIEWLTGILVAITAFYAWATFKILRANERVVLEMQEQSLAATRPYVVAAPVLEPDNPIFYLKISNLGRTPALNLRLSLAKSFQKFGEEAADRDIAAMSAFNQPIDSFPAGAEITFSLAQGFVVFAGKTENPKLPQTFCITAQYEFAGRQVTEVNRIDLRPYLGADVPQDAYLRKLKAMVVALESIAENGRAAP